MEYAYLTVKKTRVKAIEDSAVHALAKNLTVARTWSGATRTFKHKMVNSLTSSLKAEDRHT